MTASTLLLGTAQWGWTVSRPEAFLLLDAWLAAGFRGIDAATNYPINKNPADFRASEKILLEYIQAHGIRDLQITMKIGSLNNLRTPEINLSPSFILMMAEEYRRLFSENLHGIMLHWDNRGEETVIHESLVALRTAHEVLSLTPGLSGLRHPEIYAAANQAIGLSFDFELKHNILHSDLPRYASFAGAGHRFFAYGINAGGLKMDGPYPAESTFLNRGGDPEKAAEVLEKIRPLLSKWNTAQVRPPVRTMNHVGLIFSELQPRLNGTLLGVRSVAQLQETLDFRRNLETFDYSDVYRDLEKIQASPS